MKMQTVFVFAAVCVASTFSSALADNDWFNKWDRNHDNRWTWQEFRNAHKDWARHHKREAEACWTDKQLHEKWAMLDAEHHGWVTPEQAMQLHAW